MNINTRTIPQEQLGRLGSTHNWQNLPYNSQELYSTAQYHNIQTRNYPFAASSTVQFLLPQHDHIPTRQHAALRSTSPHRRYCNRVLCVYATETWVTMCATACARRARLLAGKRKVFFESGVTICYEKGPPLNFCRAEFCNETTTCHQWSTCDWFIVVGATSCVCPCR